MFSAAKVIIIVCCQLSFPREEEEVIKCTIKSKFKDEDKVIITSFQGGKIDLEPKLFLKYLMSPMPNTNPDPQERISASKNPAYGLIQHPSALQSVPSLYPTLPTGSQYNPHSPGMVTSQPSYSYAGTSDLQAPQNPACGPSAYPSAPPFNPAVTAGSQYYASSPGIVARQPSYPHTSTSGLWPVMNPTQTIMLKARLRNGRISNRPEDIMYGKPYWDVPDYLANTLLRQHSNISEADLVVLSDENGELSFQVYDKKSTSTPDLALDEFVKLQTRLHSGNISFEPKDVEIRAKNWWVPDDMVKSLKMEYR